MRESQDIPRGFCYDDGLFFIFHRVEFTCLSHIAQFLLYTLYMQNMFYFHLTVNIIFFFSDERLIHNVCVDIKIHS